MALQFGVFDHIEPIPGQTLDQIYRHRLHQVDRFDAEGFYAYHLAEHHTPAVHSLAPSQNVFLAAAARSTRQIKLCPCVYVLPLHHPIRLIEEICMLDHLSNGRLEVGVGRGGVLEAYFWGSEWEVERNYAKYVETLAILRHGLSQETLTYHGAFYHFDDLPMRLRPKQTPYPPLWYMRNVEIAAQEGMHSVIVGTLDSFEPNVARYKDLWTQYHGAGALTVQGTAPKIGLVTHMVIAETDQEAVDAARPAWEQYVWNLQAPRRLEAERRGLTQFAGEALNPRPAALPDREAGAAYRPGTALEPVRHQRRAEPGQVTAQSPGAGFRVVAGTPETIRTYLDEYLLTGANYFVCAFHFGNMPEAVAERSIDLFISDVMPYYRA